MTTNDAIWYTAAKARIDALGLLVVTDAEHSVYVVDPKMATLVCLAGDVNDLERWASEFEAERSDEREVGAPRIADAADEIKPDSPTRQSPINAQ